MKQEGDTTNLQLADLNLVHWIVHTDQLKYGGKIAKYSYKFQMVCFIFGFEIFIVKI